MGYRTVPVPLLRIHKSGVKIRKPRESFFELSVAHNFLYRLYLENGWSYGFKIFNGFLLLSHRLPATPTAID